MIYHHKLYFNSLKIALYKKHLAIKMSNQITVEQVVNVLEATLKPESVKKAQDELVRFATIPGMP